MTVSLAVDGQTDKFVHQKGTAEGAALVLALGSTAIIPVTLTCYAGLIASGAVLADTQVVADAMRVNGGSGGLIGLRITDWAKRGIAMDVDILRSLTSIGTLGSPVSISAANAASEILRTIRVLSTHWVQSANYYYADLTYEGDGLAVQAADDDSDLYIAVTARGAATFAVNDLTTQSSWKRN